MNNKFAVVTTFHESGYIQYGKRMIETFLTNWPTEVQLYIYAEDCNVVETAPNLIVYDLHTESPELVAFKEKWRGVPKAIGQEPKGPPGRNGKQPGIGFKWDAIRFAHKVYSIFHVAKNTDADILLWMDADMVCHSPITVEKLNQLCPSDYDLAFLGRGHKYSECGLYAMNLRSANTRTFLDIFQAMYDDAEHGIFTLNEWHDSYVFDEVRNIVHHISAIKELDWAKGLIKGEGHPLINSEWGAYLDHLKGSRKDLGKSKSSDILVDRNEEYWK